MSSSPHLSFYAPAPEVPRDDVLGDYLRFLEARNGDLRAPGGFPRREGWLHATESWTVRHRGTLNADDFARGYVQFDPAMRHDLPMMALLAFVKVNAGEAYGVEVIGRIRHARPPTSDLFDQVERLLSREETYHTRILAGATRQFGLQEPAFGWRPTVAHRLLFSALSYAPKTLFHPILLGAEIGGVFILDWMLKRVGELFRDEPELRETLESRLLEILTDEVGHIAFNRLVVGPSGRGAAKRLAGLVAQGTTGGTPEFRALGWTSDTLAMLDRFDLPSLPETVRRNAFFV